MAQKPRPTSMDRTGPMMTHLTDRAEDESLLAESSGPDIHVRTDHFLSGFLRLRRLPGCTVTLTSLGAKDISKQTAPRIVQWALSNTGNDHRHPRQLSCELHAVSLNMKLRI